MAEIKTQATKANVTTYLRGIADPERRADCQTLIKLMKAATKAEPVLWGPSIVGFGSSPCVYSSGRVVDWFVVGFASRKSDLVLYLMGGLEPHADLLAELGPHKIGKSCLYVKRLEAVDQAVLKKLIAAAVKRVRSQARQQPTGKKQ